MMRVMRRILVAEGVLPDEVLRRQRKQCADVNQAPADGGLDVTLERDEDRAVELVHLLGECGVHCDPRTNVPGVVCHDFKAFEGSDLDQCNYLELSCRWSASPRSESIAVFTSGVGTDRSVVVSDLPREGEFVQSPSGSVLIPSRVKDLLESASFEGLRCDATTPLEVDGGIVRSMTWSDAGSEPWFVLDSCVQMPWVSPSMKILDRRKNEVSREDENARYMMDATGLYPLERVYLEPEVTKIGSFDVARARDFHALAHAMPMISSRKFWRFCCEHNLRADWIPVHLERT